MLRATDTKTHDFGCLVQSVLTFHARSGSPNMMEYNTPLYAGIPFQTSTISHAMYGAKGDTGNGVMFSSSHRYSIPVKRVIIISSAGLFPSDSNEVV